MPGLRRLTLNHNPDIGDPGCGELAEALREDLWVRAVDLQNCGITEVGARGFQHCLKLNTSLLIVDLRQNAVSESSLQLIHEQISVNSSTQPSSEFCWSCLEPDPYTGEDLVEKIRSVGKRRFRQAMLRGPLQQPPFKAGHPPGPILQGSLHKSRSVPHLSSRPHSAGSKRSSTPSSVRRSLFRPLSASKASFESAPSTPSHSQGTANRRQADHSTPRGDVTEADMRREYLVDMEPAYAFSTRPVYSSRSRPPTPPAHTSGYPFVSAQADKISDKSHTPVGLVPNGYSHSGTELSDLQLRVRELEQRLEQVDRGREEAEYKVVELEIENRTLQRKLELMSHRNSIPTEQTAAGVDESTLEAIEQSLQQFHGFIDRLRSQGYGHLLTLLSEEK